MHKKFKVVVDASMPGIDSLFADIADISYVNGRDITNEMLLNADALLCRSITKVNEELLKNTKVQLVGTATIGIDHLDTNWLERNNIKWSNAAGCNAPAVGQYVLSAIAYWCVQHNYSMQDLTVGIVGAGNVGTVLARYLDHLSIKYKLCDPLLQKQGDSRSFESLENTMKCNVISIHVPLTEFGDYPTQYLISKPNLESLAKEQLLINASRGAVVNNKDLDEYLVTENACSVALDVFENEPNICASLVERCLLSTPHIAGHTLEGKLRGSWLIYLAFCKHFGIEVNRQELELYPNQNFSDLSNKNLEESLLSLYDVSLDSIELKNNSVNELPIKFDQLRKNATQLSNGITRRDYSGWNITNALANLQFLK